MGAHQIGDVDVVADAGAVGRRVVGAEHIHLGAFAESCLDRHLDEMGCALGGLPGAQLGVGAGDVEITQDHVIEGVGDAGIAQHDLGHELRGAVGRHRGHRIILADRHLGGVAVDRCGRGEDELVDAAPDGAFDQGA